MSDEQIKDKIKEFLKKCQLATISTVDTEHNKPESALVAFAENEQLEIVFGTSNTSRKYKNLQRNTNVSFVIGFDHMGTMQYEGVARELSDAEKAPHAERMATKNPRAAKFMDRPDQRYFLVKPTWIRLLDMSKKPEETFEIKL